MTIHYRSYATAQAEAAQTQILAAHGEVEELFNSSGLFEDLDEHSLREIQNNLRSAKDSLQEAHRRVLESQLLLAPE